MDVVVTGRHCEVSDRFRSHVNDKLLRLEKHDHRIIRVQVEVENERNPRQADRAVRVELTAFSKGPVIRAEAAADDKMGALDLAVDKMAAQMRRAADRRQTHRARGTKAETAAELAALAGQGEEAGQAVADAEQGAERHVGPIAVTGEGPLVVREKTHDATPDDAGPGSLRDGAGGPRLLPLRRQGERASVGRLPPSRLRLRRHLPRPDRVTRSGHETAYDVGRSGDANTARSGQASAMMRA